MMGTAGENKVNDEKPVVKFIEDMTEAEMAQELQFSPGLENLGNTCYANATIQCLNAVPELKTTLQKFQGLPSNDVNQTLTAGMRDLFTQMNKSTSPVQPLIFILVRLPLSPFYPPPPGNEIHQIGIFPPPPHSF